MEENRKNDFTVFGATGFTGAFIAEYLVQKLLTLPAVDEGGSEFAKLNVCLAGRNEKKLQKLLDQLQKIVQKDGNDKGKGRLGLVEIALGDVKDEKALNGIAKNSVILLNCTGPFRYFGEPVVKACAENGTHYLDITGEPEFMEKMEFKYNDVAKNSGAIIVPGAGFDSIPGDLGVIFTQKQFHDKDVKPVYVEQVLKFKSMFHAHYATFESAVLGVASQKQLQALRKKVGKRAIPSVNGYKAPRVKIQYDKKEKRRLVPFPGADASVIKRTQYFLSEKQKEHPEDVIHCSKHATYVEVKSSFNYYRGLVLGGMFALLSGTGFGRSLLLKFPGFFSGGFVSHKGPTKEEMEKVGFTFVCTAHGIKGTESKPSVKVVCTVSGPEMGYVATPICIVDAAFTLYEETTEIREFVGSNGGVLTPGSAFYNTTLTDRLTADGVKFEVASNDLI